MSMLWISAATLRDLALKIEFKKYFNRYRDEQWALGVQYLVEALHQWGFWLLIDTFGLTEIGIIVK